MANKEWCAWCLSENDTLQNQGNNDSHGVCDDHAEQLLVNFYQNKFDAVPSYVERFKLDKSAQENEQASEQQKV